MRETAPSGEPSGHYTHESPIHDYAFKDNSVLTRIITDGYPGYNGIGSEYAGGHESVCHSTKEYVRATFTPTPLKALSHL